jgi:hypothetical protein
MLEGHGAFSENFVADGVTFTSLQDVIKNVAVIKSNNGVIVFIVKNFIVILNIIKAFLALF